MHAVTFSIALMQHSKGQPKVSRLNPEWLLSAVRDNDVIWPDMKFRHEPRSAATIGVMDLMRREEALLSALNTLSPDGVIETTVTSRNSCCCSRQPNSEAFWVIRNKKDTTSVLVQLEQVLG